MKEQYRFSIKSTVVRLCADLFSTTKTIDIFATCSKRKRLIHCKARDVIWQPITFTHHLQLNIN